MLGGKTIAVIGTPLDKYFPISNKDLQNVIAEKYLLVSQFPKDYPVTPKSFPIRNRTLHRYGSVSSNPSAKKSFIVIPSAVITLDNELKRKSSPFSYLPY